MQERISAAAGSSSQVVVAQSPSGGDHFSREKHRQVSPQGASGHMETLSDHFTCDRPIFPHDAGDFFLAAGQLHNLLPFLY